MRGLAWGCLGAAAFAGIAVVACGSFTTAVAPDPDAGPDAGKRCDGDGFFDGDRVVDWAEVDTKTLRFGATTGNAYSAFNVAGRTVLTWYKIGPDGRSQRKDARYFAPLGTSNEFDSPAPYDDELKVAFDVASCDCIKIVQRSGLDEEFVNPVPLVVDGIDPALLDKVQEPYIRGSRVYFSLAFKTDAGKSQEDLWAGDLDGTTIKNPAILANINAPEGDGHPTLPRSELVIYFSSKRQLGDEYQHMWVARRASTKEPFGTPRAVNGVFNDAVPDAGAVKLRPTWVSEDDCRLFYTREANDVYELHEATRSK